LHDLKLIVFAKNIALTLIFAGRSRENILLKNPESLNRLSGRFGHGGVQCADFPLRIAFETAILQRYDFIRINISLGAHEPGVEALRKAMLVGYLGEDEDIGGVGRNFNPTGF
jgi:hypothetical protein